MMAIPAQYLNLVKQASARYGVPMSGLEAQINMESGWNPNARSPAGALGIAQFMPGTARSYGVNPLDPASAIPGMARMMANEYHSFGNNWLKALAAYNAGPGNIGAGMGYAQKLLPYYTGSHSAPASLQASVTGMTPAISSSASIAPLDFGAVLGAVGLSPNSEAAGFLSHIMSMLGPLSGGPHNAAASVATTLVGAPGGSQQQNMAVHDALSQVGVPYVWGGTSPGKGLDCSGLVQYAWKQAGVNIPRTTYQQIAALPHVDGGMSSWRPGDLIYPEPGHVGMYIGGGKIVEAPYTGTNVQVVPVSGGWAHPYAVRRP
jgi:hypothetical protein